MFKEDLEEWKKAEREFAALLISTWWASEVKIPEWRFPDYDIWAKKRGGREKTFEIKTNKIYNTTGDVAFEVHNGWKPSAILTSKADYIVYQLGWEFYYQETWLLRWLLHTLPHEEKMWGDGGKSTLYIIKWEYMSDLFKKLWKWEN